jgi:hypothetical protein
MSMQGIDDEAGDHSCTSEEAGSVNSYRKEEGQREGVYLASCYTTDFFLEQKGNGRLPFALDSAKLRSNAKMDGSP